MGRRVSKQRWEQDVEARVRGTREPGGSRVRLTEGERQWLREDSARKGGPETQPRVGGVPQRRGDRAP